MEKKKKIIYIVTQAEWGGAQKYIFDLATNLAADFDITIATGPDGKNYELLEKLKTVGITTHLFKHLKREINPYHDFLAVVEVAKFLKDGQFDIVHLNSSKAGVIGGLAGWMGKEKKIIYTAHGWVFLEPLPSWKKITYLSLEKISKKLRDATIVLSETEKKASLQYGVAKKNSLFVIPNGIDLEKTEFLEKERAREEILKQARKDTKNSLLIGAVANLYKTKGLNLLIEAFKNLSDTLTEKNLRLIIIGEGPERKNLEIQIKNLQLEDKIFLVGFIPEANKYLKAFDIFVLPSLKEGFPYTILEALSAGLPIIATKVGAIPEIINNEQNGLLIDAGKTKDLSEAIKKILNDENLKIKLEQGAVETSKKYSLKEMIEETKKIY